MFEMDLPRYVPAWLSHSLSGKEPRPFLSQFLPSASPGSSVFKQGAFTPSLTATSSLWFPSLYFQPQGFHSAHIDSTNCSMTVPAEKARCRISVSSFAPHPMCRHHSKYSQRKSSSYTARWYKETTLRLQWTSYMP
jgi:hypothetical protein